MKPILIAAMVFAMGVGAIAGTIAAIAFEIMFWFVLARSAEFIWACYENMTGRNG